MPDLSKALNADPLKFKDKAVKSVRSRVTNISEHLKTPMDVMEFSTLIENHIMEKYPEAILYELSEEDHARIGEMVQSKYGTWEWNFGYSPQYNFRKVLRTNNSGTLEFNIDVTDGIIRDIKVFGDYFNMCEPEEIENALRNVQHTEGKIRDVLTSYNISDYFNNLTVDEFVTGMF
jgi:lipoate-protein ligase A